MILAAIAIILLGVLMFFILAVAGMLVRQTQKQQQFNDQIEGILKNYYAEILKNEQEAKAFRQALPLIIERQVKRTIGPLH